MVGKFRLRVLSAACLLICAVLCLVMGARTLPEALLEFRLRFQSEALFADALAPDAQLQATFIVATVDKYPNNAKLQAIGYRAAILLDRLRGDDLLEDQAAALVERGERLLLNTPTNPFLWLNQANAAAVAFEEVPENDPALEALRKSFDYGLFEFRLFAVRLLFCRDFVTDKDSDYAQLCARQLSLFKSLRPREFESFQTTYGFEAEKL